MELSSRFWHKDVPALKRRQAFTRQIASPRYARVQILVFGL
jgi:hypothetical protein